MSGYVLDTNVVSETTRDLPDARVVEFLTVSDDVWLASVVVHELEFGLRLLAPGQRRDRLVALTSASLPGTVNESSHSIGRARSGLHGSVPTPEGPAAYSTSATP